MLVLHHAWRSSASRRVRLCLAEKGLKFESVLVDLAKMEHHTPEYLKLNPNGVIPLLILDDGHSLYESGTICEYLDETYPAPPLRPPHPSISSASPTLRQTGLLGTHRFRLLSAMSR